MSAIITLTRQHAVDVLTDGAAYDEDGILRAVVGKAIALPTLPAVITARGPLLFLQAIAFRASAIFSSFDELVDGIEARFDELVDNVDELLAGSGQPACELYIAGWSARRNRPEAYLFRTHSVDWTPEKKISETISNEAGKLIELDVCSITPGPYVADLKAAGFTGDEDPDKLGPEDLLRIMEVQRRMSFDGTNGKFHGVGGLALLSSVTRDGVAQRVIHRWPDRVGELIKPEPVEPTVGLSRLRRDIAARRARKRAAQQPQCSGWMTGTATKATALDT